jgi:hypothetical protein
MGSFQITGSTTDLHRGNAGARRAGEKILEWGVAVGGEAE